MWRGQSLVGLGQWVTLPQLHTFQLSSATRSGDHPNLVRRKVNHQSSATVQISSLLGPHQTTRPTTRDPVFANSRSSISTYCTSIKQCLAVPSSPQVWIEEWLGGNTLYAQSRDDNVIVMLFWQIHVLFDKINTSLVTLMANHHPHNSFTKQTAIQWKCANFSRSNARSFCLQKNCCPIVVQHAAGRNRRRTISSKHFGICKRRRGSNSFNWRTIHCVTVTVIYCQLVSKRRRRRRSSSTETSSRL